MKISDPTVQFSHFEPKYKCCCGTVHVKQGSVMIAGVSVILAVFGLFGIFLNRESKFTVLLEILSLAVEIVCLVLLYIGIRRERKVFLLPFLGYQVISLIASVLMLCACLWAIFDIQSPAAHYIRDSTLSEDEKELERAMNKEPQVNMMTRMAASFLSMALILALMLTIWFTIVVYRCYTYFRDLDEARKQNDTPVKFEASDRENV